MLHRAAPIEEQARPRRTSRTTAALAAHPGRRDIGLLLVAYLLYGASRWLATGDLAAAVGRAHWIADAESSLGISVEAGLQRDLSAGAAVTALTTIYLAAQLAVVPGVLVLTYRRRRPIYRRLRTTVVVTWALAAPVFALIPVAPPRLAGVGLADSLSASVGPGLNSHLATAFYNPLAAVPSLHCGFALAVSIALVRTLPALWMRLAAAAWTPMVIVAVLATGNHFVLDVLSGLVITLLGFGVGQLALRAHAPRSQRRPPFGAPALHGSAA